MNLWGSTIELTRQVIDLNRRMTRSEREFNEDSQRNTAAIVAQQQLNKPLMPDDEQHECRNSHQNQPLQEEYVLCCCVEYRHYG